MGANSSIEWTDHTFNPWWGCVKVSPGCQHCYAETLSKRFGNDIWGPAKTTSRRVFGLKHWDEPLKWNAEAAKAGQRKRVFCASMADVFEAHPLLNDERFKLWDLIDHTPNLDWLLLTKRPENIARMMPIRWGTDPYLGIFDDTSLMPANVWVGISVEDQQRADERIPELLRVPARVRFLSCEPLLGLLNLDHYLIDDWTRIGDDVHWHEHPAIHWVIAGGESGPGARPMHPDWARSLRDQCSAAGVAFHFKQWGNWSLRDAPDAETGRAFVNVGKHAAGRLLDGREWNDLPI